MSIFIFVNFYSFLLIFLIAVFIFLLFSCLLFSFYLFYFLSPVIWWSLQRARACKSTAWVKKKRKTGNKKLGGVARGLQPQTNTVCLLNFARKTPKALKALRRKNSTCVAVGRPPGVRRRTPLGHSLTPRWLFCIALAPESWKYPRCLHQCCCHKMLLSCFFAK